MATAREAVTDCPICLEEFEDPKCLSCLHTFCKSCVDKMMRGNGIVCPTCRTCTHKSKIKSDFKVKQIIDALQEAEGNRRVEAKVISDSRYCDLCEQNAVACKCIECDQWMCDHCKQIHLKMKGIQQHQINSIQEISVEAKRSLLPELKSMKEKVKATSGIIVSYTNMIESVKKLQVDELAASSFIREECIEEIYAQFYVVDDIIVQETEEIIKTLNFELCDSKDFSDRLNDKYLLLKNKFDNDHIDIIFKTKSMLKEVEGLKKEVLPKPCTTPAFGIKKGMEWKPASAVTFSSPDGEFEQRRRKPRRKFQFIAQYDQEAEDDDEVSFIEGDVIVNAVVANHGWIRGTVKRSGHRGLIPGNYLIIADDTC